MHAHDGVDQAGRMRRLAGWLALTATVASLAGFQRAHAQASDHPTRPIEVTIVVSDQAPRCNPQELRVPADGNVDLRIQNQGARPVAVRAPDLFRKDAIRTVTNTEAEPGQGGGYVVASRGSAQMIVKAPPQGQYRFACVDPGAAAGEATGTLTTVR